MSDGIKVVHKGTLVTDTNPFPVQFSGAKYSPNASGVDAVTESLVYVDYEHHEIHNGDHYFFAGFETLAASASANFVFETPNSNKWLHLTFIAEGTSQLEFYVHEGVSASADGSVVTAFNNNRNSANTSVVTIRKNPTITNQGTIIFPYSNGVAGTTAINTTKVGLIDRNKEIILKQNSKTLIRVISRDAANIVSYCAEWYEHINNN